MIGLDWVCYIRSEHAVANRYHQPQNFSAAIDEINIILKSSDSESEDEGTEFDDFSSPSAR